jgi:hypothetical protein
LVDRSRPKNLVFTMSRSVHVSYERPNIDNLVQYW